MFLMHIMRKVFKFHFAEYCTKIIMGTTRAEGGRFAITFTDCGRICTDHVVRSTTKIIDPIFAIKTLCQKLVIK